MAQAKVTNVAGKEEKEMKLTPSKLECFITYHKDGSVKGYTIKLGQASYWMDPELTVTRKYRDKETKEVKEVTTIDAFKMSEKSKGAVTATKAF